jgi:hypothetical protein
MTEDQAIKAQAQSREFPETMEILGRVRGALVEQVFKTPVGASAQREDLYTRVQAIDALIVEMDTILTGIKADRDYTAYAESIATTEK